MSKIFYVQCMAIDRKKEIQLDSVFEKLGMIREECTKQKASNLVLMALQEDKQHIDAWDAFGKIGWSKSF